MENLIFSLNATVPVFLLMLVGLFLNKIGWIDEVFASRMNKFVFRVALPVKVFLDLGTVDFSKVWNLKFVGFCFIATLLSITIAFGISCLLNDKSIKGEFIQAAYRSSAAILGLAFIQNIYGNSGMAPLMIIGSVPLYNMMAVVVLAFFDPANEGKKIDSALLKKTARGVVTNPLIVCIAAGLLWSALKLPIPQILNKTLSNIGTTATPLGLMAMGASFDIKKAFNKKKPACIAAFIKLVGLELIFLPIAVRLGFRNQDLVAIIVMLGSATTVSSYVMARNMDHEGVLSSSVVMLTTMFSAFTLTFWLFATRSLGLI